MIDIGQKFYLASSPAPGHHLQVKVMDLKFLC